MRKVQIFMYGKTAGTLIEENGNYTFTYLIAYNGPAISLTMPLRTSPYQFDHFPALFEGLLPEGPQLEALLHHADLARDDYLGQLIKVGQDLAGAITLFSAEKEA